MSKGKAYKQIIEKLNKMLQVEASNWYKICVLAYKFYAKKGWEHLGYNSCRELFQDKVIPQLSYEAFMYRVKIGECVTRLDIKEKDVHELGLTKFKELASLFLTIIYPEQERKALIDSAKNMTVEEVKELVRKHKAKAKGIEEEEVGSARFSFTIPKEDKELVEEALHIAMKKHEVDNAAQAFVLICADYVASHPELATRMGKEFAKKEIKRGRRIIARKKDIRTTVKEESNES